MDYLHYYDDYFFDEPSELEQQIIEFKSALAESVKDEIKAKIEALEKENAELREFRDMKEQYEASMRKKMLEYDTAIERAKTECLRASLKKIFGENLETAYRVDSEYEKFRKCSRCDDSRRIKYKTPLGRDALEDCVCNRSMAVWSPIEVKLFSFTASSRPIYENPHTSLYYERKEENRDFDRYDMCGEVYDGRPFDKVNAYRAVFFDLEKCQEYCDWLNRAEREEKRVYADEWGLEFEYGSEEHHD